MVFFLFIKLTGNVMPKCYEFAKLIKDQLHDPPVHAAFI